MVSCRYSDSIAFELILSVFRVVPPVTALETEGTPGASHPQPILASRPVSPRPLSLSIERQGILRYVLERDEARRLHSNSIHEVTQLKVCMDYLQAVL